MSLFSFCCFFFFHLSLLSTLICQSYRDVAPAISEHGGPVTLLHVPLIIIIIILNVLFIEPVITLKHMRQKQDNGIFRMNNSTKD